MRAITEDTVRGRLQGKNLEMLSYGGSIKANAKFRCLKDGCGCEWETPASNVTRGHSGCPRCAKVERVTEEMVLDRLKGRQIALVRYAGTVMKDSRFACLVDDCGCEWDAPVNDLRAGNGCPRCAGRERVTEATLLKRIDGRNIEVLYYPGVVHKKSRFRCTIDGHEWETEASVVMAGHGCAKCSGRLPVSIDEALAALQGRTIELVKYAGASSGRSTFRCLVDGCGHEWGATLNDVKQGKGCKKCAGKLKVTEEGARKKLEGLPIRLIEFGGSATAKSAVQCTVDGHIWRATITSLTGSRKRGCPKCGGRMRMTEQSAKDRLFGRPIEMLEFGGKSHSDSKFQCLVEGCGHTWSADTKSVVTSGGGCPKCAGKLPITRAEAERRIAHRDIEVIEYRDAIRLPATFRCTKTECGHEWEALAYSVVNQGLGCPCCSVSGYKPNEEGTFYVYKIAARHDTFLGFGITNNMKRRHTDHGRNFADYGVSGDLVFSVAADGFAVQDFEREMKRRPEITSAGVPGFVHEAMLWNDGAAVQIIQGARALPKFDRVRHHPVIFP